MKKSYPAALPPPKTDVTYLSSALYEDGINVSNQSTRKRVIVPLHKKESDTLHRMFNVMQPETYIRPHYHKRENKCESVIVLKGAICFITFSLEGIPLSFKRIEAGTEYFGVDLEPNVIHSFLVLEKNTIIYEVKPGPYIKSSDKDFMTWAPEEGTEESLLYLENLKNEMLAVNS
ncbi:WbuC family cupin fold metalloprotein [Neptunitalea lumnitzerae]|uniref:Cupin fold metalloprotein WbuC cupin domain-containing protein n=1 Tax=Neptunitalea lumnitzerae TaxID=2965509 RepID=A0ABQ5MJK9_9FLAO|nr:WbuC family cupin fold metalloprotein [Neptunitalea sp. Y10]GLB49563.1 hypothetical protein Y10_19310 [Neptunitalea sp. Y10]